MTDTQAPNPRVRGLDWAAEELGLDERTIRLEVIRMVMRQDSQSARPIEMAETLAHFILTGERLRPSIANAVAADPAPFTDVQEERLQAIVRATVAKVLAGSDARIRDAIDDARRRGEVPGSELADALKAMPAFRQTYPDGGVIHPDGGAGSTSFITATRRMKAVEMMVGCMNSLPRELAAADAIVTFVETGRLPPRDEGGDRSALAAGSAPQQDGPASGSDSAVGAQASTLGNLAQRVSAAETVLADLSSRSTHGGC